MRIDAHAAFAHARVFAIGVFTATNLARLSATAPQLRDGHRGRQPNNHGENLLHEPRCGYAFGKSFENRSASFSK